MERKNIKITSSLRQKEFKNTDLKIISLILFKKKKQNFVP